MTVRVAHLQAVEQRWKAKIKQSFPVRICVYNDTFISIFTHDISRIRDSFLTEAKFQMILQ